MAEIYIALDDRQEYNIDEEVYGDPTDIFLRDLWRPRRHTNVDLSRAAEAKDLDKYIHLAGGLDQTLLRIIMEKDSVKFPKEKIILLVIEVLRRGANVNCTDSKGDTPLHLSATRGFVELARELRKWGAEPNIVNSVGHTPMEIAIHLGLSGGEDVVEIYNVFATFIIKEMEPSRVRECFLADADNPARISFHNLLSHPNMKETVQVVLDCLIERVPGHKTTYTVHYSVLETDKDGMVLSNKSGLATNKTTALEEIAWKCNKEAVTHLSVLLLTQSKWKRFARTFFILNFVYWLVLMCALACALVLAASRDDPRSYDQPLDVFRGCCEGLSILLLALTALREFYSVLLWRVQYFKQYFFFIYNYLNILTVVFVAVLIPLRVINSDVQWIFSSLTYVAYAFRVFKYLQAIPVIGKFILILYRILVRDMIPFLLVSLVVIFIFAGALYFSLREEVLETFPVISNCSMNETFRNMSWSDSNQTVMLRTSLDVNPEETGTYPRVFLTGLRLIIEGQNFLTYFGVNGYQFLGVFVYIIFLFVLQVVLLNMLIAQMADTYSSVQEDAQRALVINQARNIVSIERSGLSILKCVTDFFVSEEIWKNPRSHVHQINQKSLDNINANTKLIKVVLNHHNLLLEEMRDSIGDQKMVLSKQIERLVAPINELTEAV